MRNPEAEIGNPVAITFVRSRKGDHTVLPTVSGPPPSWKRLNGSPTDDTRGVAAWTPPLGDGAPFTGFPTLLPGALPGAGMTRTLLTVLDERLGERVYKYGRPWRAGPTSAWNYTSGSVSDRLSAVPLG